MTVINTFGLEDACPPANTSVGDLAVLDGQASYKPKTSRLIRSLGFCVRLRVSDIPSASVGNVQLRS